MTIEQIQNRIDVIAAMAHDDETARALEDQLRSDFIQHIAEHGGHCRLLAQMAKLILTTDDIRFDRWYC